MNLRVESRVLPVSLAIAACCWPSRAEESTGAARFRKEVQPILTEFCYDCHADGMTKGNVTFDEFKSDQALLENRELWWNALKNLRAGIMPPEKNPRPSEAQKETIARWIKADVFEVDPKNPDPGRVTVRRLNRVEYRNTIRDLMGIDFDTEGEFPPDDTGHGFDNIGDVLTISPMLLEKYMGAANVIVAKAVPTAPKMVAEKIVMGRNFLPIESGTTNLNLAEGRPSRGPLTLSYYDAALVAVPFRAPHAGRYKLIVDLMANERYVDDIFDYNKCRLIFRVNGKELLRKEFARQSAAPFHFEFDQDWQAGEQRLSFEVVPLTPDEPQVRSLSLRVDSVTVRGPSDEKHWVQPANYGRFFSKTAPRNPADRLVYARELLANFTTKAFRRPADDKTVDRLAGLAEEVYRQPGKTFEAGIAQAMVTVLASPRFLFREEAVEPADGDQTHPLLDEYALASRLSYFLWSSMPDDELFRLAREKKLRANLSAQVARMLADSRSEAFVKNFAGQWLQARDIESVAIEARAVLTREEKFDPEAERMRKRFRELRDRPDEKLTKEESEEIEQLRARIRSSSRRRPRAELSGELRRAMRRETEEFFGYIVREDRKLLELIDSDYTFLNESLSRHYGLTNVLGDEMRRVKLPPDSPRGGILTHGTVLTVTSNPTRTSPVKRGVFILENILGTPPPPPPPNIPPLEDATKSVTNRAPSLRETLAAHRADALCSSCHNRMDPLGLALENFNAMGMWREREFDEPIDAAGKLITGEKFTSVRELKRILAENHSRDFYHCITEKLLIYALGRGLDYYDVEAVDRIVERIEKENGRFSALLAGVIESVPFQKRRNAVTLAAVEPSKPMTGATANP